MSEQPETPEIIEGKKLFFPKSLKAYLFEFILLTLAVFLGFLAENFREEWAEKHQAEELAQSYYDELLADSTSLHDVLALRYQKDSAITDFKNYVLDSNLQDVSRNYIRSYALGIHLSSRFEPTDVILEQLKNSGSLRYFKSQEIQHLTGSLSAAIGLVRQRNSFELEFIQNHLIHFMIEHNDQKFYDKLSQKRVPIREGIRLCCEGKLKIPYQISNLANFDRNKVNNLMGIHSIIIRGSNGHYHGYRDLNSKLLSALRREYAVN